MSHQLNNHFDTDLDAYLNFDQAEQTPMSSTSDVKPVPALLHQSSAFSSNNEAFSGPTYQYDSHRQQTGLPMGGYANTLAVNQASGLHYRPSNMGFVMPTETLNIPLSNLDEFDFNRSQFDYPDMDIESESQADIPSMFYHGDGQSSISPSTQIPPRIYPGMHTKQAAQAKIQQAQKQSEMVKQQERQLPAGQKPLPTGAPKSPTVKDPHVEESISRLLNRMRQSSNASADDDDEDSPVAGMSGMPRMKKDEDDMDEDERLLNSEEGKKLTSKERRQLRNKVSARAFRSRRKEYITQLEAEVAGKVQEANELRVQNRQLMEENTRLTDLTRMLLSSQAFSGFLHELSQSGNTQNIPQPQALQQPQPQQQASRQSQSQAQPQTQPTRKDVSSHEASRQMPNLNQHMQVGMTLIPETPIDMSVFDGHNMWNTVIPSNDFQVFSVTDLPEPPKLDMASLIGKPASDDAIYKLPANAEKDIPVISSLPAPPAIETTSDLYIDNSSPSTINILPTPHFTSLTKASAPILSVSTLRSSSTGSWSHLMQLCKELDESCERLGQLMN